MSTSSSASPLIASLRAGAPALWINPDYERQSAQVPELDAQVAGAEHRLRRAAGLLRSVFPELRQAAQPIRSPILPADDLAAALGVDTVQAGRWLVKADHQLPVAGSIKARGGFHEVITYAERLGLEHGLIAAGGDLAVLASPRAREVFSRHSVVVGSTGNLGLSIGLMSAALGFSAIVHMSRDAKGWKKQRLRDHGVTVVEHPGDYAAAVEEGRRLAEADPQAHFVDDERSVELFVGYAAAASELQAQLAERGVAVDAAHPLFVYLPCGVGGAPGGVTYGLKHLFGPHVHCVFAEPVEAPCMLVQMIAGPTRPTSVYDYGLSNQTAADGLAVPQASMLVAPLMRARLAGIYTVSDDQLFGLLQRAFKTQSIRVEPSAAAGFAGPLFLTRDSAGQAFLDRWALRTKMGQATHVVWTTGGSLVPDHEQQAFLTRTPTAAAPYEVTRQV